MMKIRITLVLMLVTVYNIQVAQMMHSSASKCLTLAAESTLHESSSTTHKSSLYRIPAELPASEYAIGMTQSSSMPTILCPGNITLSTSPGNCFASPVDLLLVSYSGTPPPDLTWAISGSNSGSGTGEIIGYVFNTGSSMVVYTATNIHGSATCSFLVVVNDLEPPAITGLPYADPIVYSGCFSEAENAAPPFDQSKALQGYTDNCAAGSFLSETLPEASVAGNNCNWLVTYTYLVEDAFGNTVTGQYSHYGGDQTPPVRDVNIQNGFIGSYAPANWTTVQEGDGWVYIGSSMLELYSSSLGSGQPKKEEAIITISNDAILTFSWDYYAGQWPPNPARHQFGYLLNGIFTQLSDNTGPYNQGAGSWYGHPDPGTSVQVKAGDVFGFRLVSLYDDLVYNSLVWIGDFQVMTQTATFPGLTGVSACKADAETAAPWSMQDAILGYVDNCIGPLTALLTHTEVTGTNCDWTVTYTYSVLDACGNSFTGQQYSNSGGDNINPAMTCITPSTSYPAHPVLNTWTVPDNSLDPLSISDNCTVTSTTNSFNHQHTLLGAVFPLGATTVVWNVIDACGNTAACQYVIEVISTTTPPQITCPGDMTTATQHGQCYSEPLGFNVTVSGIPDPTVSFEHTGATIRTGQGTSTGSTFEKGITTVTVFATNIGGSAQCTFTVTVNDIHAPIPDLAILPDLTGECSVTVISFPTATDHCEGTIAGTTTDPLIYAAQGTYTIIWNYDDGNGNIHTQPQTVEVMDVTAPIPDVAILPDLTGQCSVTVTVIPTSSDHCEGVIIGTTNDPMTYNSQGTFFITWTYADGNGNLTNQSQKVKVEDQTVPFIICPSNPQNVSISPPAISYTASQGEFDPVSFGDNCGNVTISNNLNGLATLDGYSFPPGATIAIWTADDGNGNTATCAITIEIATVWAQIIAHDDAGIQVNGFNGGTTFTNVLTNDLLNGIAVVANDVILTFVSSSHQGVMLSGSDVIVMPGTPAGIYTLTYEICQVLNPQNCDQANVTMTVVFDPPDRCIAPKVFLQGSFDMNTGLMWDSLRTNNLVPITEPYSSPPYNNTFIHIGGGGETVINPMQVFGVTGDDAIVDWVFIELRDKSMNHSVLSTRSALLQRDGDIVDIDGISPLCFESLADSLYYLVVRHRNHFGVMTNSPITLKSEMLTMIDFRNGMEPEFSFGVSLNNNYDYTGHAQKQLAPGIRAMWAGDANQDGRIKHLGTNTDRLHILNNVLMHINNQKQEYNYDFAYGYFSGDLNMDGRVKYTGSKADAGLLLHLILNYPLNYLLEYNFEHFIEQVPTSN